MQFVVFEKITSAYLFQIARKKSCDHVLIIYMIAYHNYAEAEHASSTKLIYSNSAFGQNNRVQSKR